MRLPPMGQGQRLGKAFLDQDFDDVVHVINTNITGTIRLAWLIGRQMRERSQGRILSPAPKPA